MIELKSNKNEGKDKSNISFNENSSFSEAKAVEPKPKKKKKKSKRKWIILAIILLAIAGVIFFKMKSGTNTMAGNYTLGTADYRNITVSVNGTGTVEPVDSYKVTALVKGEIVGAPFKEGDVIKKGALLYQIDASDVESNIEKSQIGLEKERSGLDQIQDSIGDLSIKASKAGQIVKLYVDEGDTIKAGQTIADIKDNSCMLVNVDFNASDIASIHIGQNAKVSIPSKMETIDGTVNKISTVKSASSEGAVVQSVEIKVKNPGALSTDTYADAAIGNATSVKGGNFKYNVEETVISKADGKVSSIPVSEGNWVNKNQLILALSSTNLNSQVKNSNLSIKNAEISLKEAKDSLDDYRITSPISGTIIEKNFKVGDTVDATTNTVNMVTIYDMSSLTFNMNIDELDIDKVKVGQKVEITADAVEGKKFTGKVDKINISGNTENGTTSYPVTIKIDDPQNLLPGMNVSANIMIEEAKNILTIPVGAVSRGNTVLVQNVNAAQSDSTKAASASGDSKTAPASKNDIPGFKRVEVKLGRNDDNFIEVISGIKQGDKVYVENAPDVSVMELMQGGGEDHERQQSSNKGSGQGSQKGQGSNEQESKK